MKALIILITLSLICCGPSKKERAESAELLRIEESTKLAVSQMVSRHRAIGDWGKCLKKLGFRPIFTIEFEKLWLTERPILFIGFIDDIVTYNDTDYTILIKENFFNNDWYGAGVKLSLRCPKKKIDAFLIEYQNLFSDLDFNNGVAVVAKINSIRKAYSPCENGNQNEEKIGEGELLEIQFTGDVKF